MRKDEATEEKEKRGFMYTFVDLRLELHERLDSTTLDYLIDYRFFFLLLLFLLVHMCKYLPERIMFARSRFEYYSIH